MEKLLSIVVPYYNASQLIDKLLESLDNQTKNDFEVIFVDDASLEEDIKLFKNKLKKYKFSYKIYSNTKNGGPGITRNLGIKKCSSKYLTFIDSDDFVAFDFVEKIINIIKINNPDLILFDYYLNDLNNNIVKEALPIKNDFVDKDDALALSNGMCWGKIYLKAIIEKNNISFPAIFRSEDLAFVKIFVSKCKKIFYLKDSLYYYVQNDTSIMHRLDTLNIKNNIVAYNYIKENTNLTEATKMIYIREYLYLVTQIMILKKYKNSDILKHINNFSINYPKWYKNKYLKYQPKYLRILLILIKNKMLFPLKMIFKLKK